MSNQGQADSHVVGEKDPNDSQNPTKNPKTVGSTKAELLQRIAELEEKLSFADETNQRLRQILADFEEERLSVLTVRDYAIGMEQELGRAKAELDQRNDIDHGLRTEIIDTHARLATALEDAERAKNNPYRMLKRKVGSGLRKAGLR